MKEPRKQALKVLMVEDLEADVRLFKEMMQVSDGPGLTLHRVAKVREAVEFLGREEIDLILLDLNLPDSRGIRTFERVARAARQPIIVLSGLDDEDLAIEAVHKGAQDYLVKWDADRKMMMRAMLYAIERHQLLKQLEDARSEIRSLRSLIPICAYCKRVRHDDGYWQQLESYLRQVGNVDFSHGICPECFDRLEQDELSDEKQENEKQGE